ncbi:uncharacterized protein LOC130393957 [Gadus chalcogrammus]|uniref:uncharacterized protein LOC130393957 n=1 Tax=Gadus chalcogrammus TaxID=1042646 RepID=UPI0024C494FF|nr:uncharacterized protein LOC130393957 [Gadus chalcogrammus]
MEEQQHVFNDLREVESFIEQNEAATMTKFVVYGTHASFFDNMWQPTSNTRVFWEWSRGEGTPTIAFTGTPFMFIGTKEMGCHLGRDISESKKRKEKPDVLNDNAGARKRRKRKSVQDCKKIGCPAILTVTRIAAFPQFKIVDNKDRTKRAASARLKQALQRDPVIWENVYIIKTPSPSAHTGHAVNGELIWSRKTFVRKECSDLLKHLTEKVHLVDEQRGLEHIKKKLLDLMDDVQPMIPLEARIPLSDVSEGEKRLKGSSSKAKTVGGLNTNSVNCGSTEVHLQGKCQMESTNPA